MPKDLNYGQQLIDYIKKNLKKGYSKDTLICALTNQGHSKFEIDRAFRRVEDEMARSAPVLKTKPEIRYEVVEPKEHASVKTYTPKKPFWKKFFD